MRYRSKIFMALLFIQVIAALTLAGLCQADSESLKDLLKDNKDLKSKDAFQALTERIKSLSQKDINSFLGNNPQLNRFYKAGEYEASKNLDQFKTDLMSILNQYDSKSFSFPASLPSLLVKTPKDAKKQKEFLERIKTAIDHKLDNSSNPIDLSLVNTPPPQIDVVPRKLRHHIIPKNKVFKKIIVVLISVTLFVMIIAIVWMLFFSSVIPSNRFGKFRS